MFEFTPPPVKYLIVNVVLAGEIPYVPVCKKFTGEYATVSLSFLKGNPIPTLFGFGVISSVTSLGEPAPNCICKFDKDVKRVANLLATFFKF
jgi:hypothetical protein